MIESGQLSDKFINNKNHSKHAGTDYKLYTKLYSAITFKNKLYSAITFKN